MSKELQNTLVELKRELADVELSIEQAADQGDVPTVEYYDEQQRYLQSSIKLVENQLS